MCADGCDHDDAAARALFGHLLGGELGAEVRAEDVDLLDLSRLCPAVLEEGLVEDYACRCDAVGCQGW